MARVVGGLTTSHIPAIGNAAPREKELVNDPYWKPFFAAYPPARAWLQKMNPDVVVVIYNDHGLNFFLDKMPTFAIGAAARYENADEGWGIPKTPPYRGRPGLPRPHHQFVGAREFRNPVVPGDVGKSGFYS